jgi:hypothetical protein
VVTGVSVLPVAVTVLVYDSSSVLLRTLPAGSADAPVQSAQWGPKPYNPEQGPLTLSSGAWTFTYDGKDGSGEDLSNGIYMLVIESQQGSSLTTTKVQITVVGGMGIMLKVIAVPNPAHSGGSVTILWEPSTQPGEVLIHTLDGKFVRSLGIGQSPMTWNLRSGSGEPMSDGIYLVSVRIPGQRDRHWFKLMIFK